MEALLGYPPKAFMADATLWRKLMHPDDVEITFADRSAASVVDYRMVRRDGRIIWVREAWAEVAEAHGVVRRHGYVQDITTHVERERLIARTEKLESLEVLAGGIAHDFNNLLLAITGNIELARRDLVAHPALELLRQAEDSARRAADLAAQMLTYTGREHGVSEVIEPGVLVHSISDPIRARAGGAIDVVIDAPPGLPTVRGEPTQLRQLVMNLVTNAIEAIGEGPGVVMIRLAAATLPQAGSMTALERVDAPAGQYVMVSVADSGPGLDPALIKRIFDPFFTTKFAGRGLGLAAVAGIARAHGAAIEVDRSSEGGAVFRVFVPVDGAPVATTKDPAATVPGGIGAGRGRVLVVDDDRAVRAVTTRILERSAGSPSHLPRTAQKRCRRSPTNPAWSWLSST